MVDTLDDLRTKLTNSMSRLGKVENRIVALRAEAAEKIAELDSQETLAESLKDEIEKIENEILRRSGL